MIECHIGACEYHICHTDDVDDGPFCSLGECVKLAKEIVMMVEQSGGYDDYQTYARRRSDAATESISVPRKP